MKRVDTAIREAFGNRRAAQLGTLEGLALLLQQLGLLAARVAMRALGQPDRGLQRMVFAMDGTLSHMGLETKTGHLPKPRHGSLAH
ncbi:hypothetical protein D3C71_1388850 [compost metagenome]